MVKYFIAYAPLGFCETGRMYTCYVGDKILTDNPDNALQFDTYDEAASHIDPEYCTFTGSYFIVCLEKKINEKK